MSVTPQTNTTLEAIAEKLLASNTIAICGHVRPDGDCIGSELALRNALVQLGKTVYVLLPKREPLETSLRFLPGADELVPACNFTKRCDVFVAVDVPNVERLGDGAEAQKKAAFTITIDHHACEKRMSDLSYTDPDAASTTLLIWKLCKHLGVELTEQIATCAYSGLVTDTGRFQFQNTNAECFEAAAEMVKAKAQPWEVSEQFFQRRSVASLELEAELIKNMQLLKNGEFAISWITSENMKSVGATKSDCEPLINVLRSIDGVRVCCILRDEGDKVRGSFRAKDDTDVAELANEFGGGGHKAAAGFTLQCELDDAILKVKDAVLAALSGKQMRETR